MLTINSLSTCDMCKELYTIHGSKRPSVIPCGHIACRVCLLQSVHIGCPYCGVPFVSREIRTLRASMDGQEITSPAISWKTLPSLIPENNYDYGSPQSDSVSIASDSSSAINSRGPASWPIPPSYNPRRSKYPMERHPQAMSNTWRNGRLEMLSEDGSDSTSMSSYNPHKSYRNDDSVQMDMDLSLVSTMTLRARRGPRGPERETTRSAVLYSNQYSTPWIAAPASSYRPFEAEVTEHDMHAFMASWPDTSHLDTVQIAKDFPQTSAANHAPTRRSVRCIIM